MSMFEQLRIHPASELAEKQAARIFSRHERLCKNLEIPDSNTRSGRARMRTQHKNLQNDFYTKVKMYADRHDEEHFQRFKKAAKLIL